MRVTPTELPEVLLIEPTVFGDQRGFFLETWQADRYREAGMPLPFVQDNLSFSRRGILRGLHFQNPFPQGKLVSVLRGEVFDVCVDLRHGSPRFGKWFGVSLSEENKKQLYVPPGFGHGFIVTSEEALFCYKCTALYHPESEVTLMWNDPALGISWPKIEPILSEKDRKGQLLKDIPKERLPRYS